MSYQSDLICFTCFFSVMKQNKKTIYVCRLLKILRTDGHIHLTFVGVVTYGGGGGDGSMAIYYKFNRRLFSYSILIFPRKCRSLLFGNNKNTLVRRLLNVYLN